MATPVVGRLQGIYLGIHSRRGAPAFLPQSFPPLPSTSGETLPPLLTGSAHAAQAAKARRTEGRHSGKRADVLAKENP